MSSINPQPQARVGVAVFILQRSSSTQDNQPRFLVGKRKGSHGAGTYALPGGHIEFGEEVEQCAVREVLEETGLVIAADKVRFLTATNDYMREEGKHYITMFVVCEREDEGVEAEVLEPEKCEGWTWMGWQEMVGLVEEGGKAGSEKRLFLPLVNLVKQRPGVVPSVS